MVWSRAESAISASFVVTLIDPWSANIIIDDAVIEQPRSKTAGPYNYRVSHISKVLQLLLPALSLVAGVEMQ